MGTPVDDGTVTARMPAVWLWLIRIGGPLLGCGAGFVVAPLVRRLLELTGSAPGPLQLAAQLPTEWAVPIPTLAGLVAGVWVAEAARKESPVVTIAADRVVADSAGSGVHLGGERVAAVFTDGEELVVRDRAEREIVRLTASDLPVQQLSAAFQRFGYPWRGTEDPHEAEFVRWVDGTPDLDEQAHALLRTREWALADKRAGAAADALDGLRERGVTVRDRDGRQEYRHPRRPPGRDG